VKKVFPDRRPGDGAMPLQERPLAGCPADLFLVGRSPYILLSDTRATRL
jgi:hypothetical protein